MRTRFTAPLALSLLAVFLPPLCVASLRGEENSGTLQSATRALYRGEYDQAATLVENYLQAHPQAVAGKILLARVQIAQGRYDLARQGLEQVLKSDPRNPDALYYLARLSGILSQMEFQRLFQLAPDSARAHQVMGEAYETRNKLEMAEAEYRAALKADPELVEVLVALGELQRHQFKFEEAIKHYSRALEWSRAITPVLTAWARPISSSRI